ncbi:hypothetical protein DFA_07871 [Cavenderia fasciculata]|uniref:F-box domain-containing protein n=1 Tax=Cavenderia fasciculata TaxID=261658 RepID=F4Q3S4_CACFS|nr:uncharacterized protein DFA_07871 [Cavenderia fasciculata]EGG16890.1 hypothetical protein DFA_07871 [Cavenderia fasciculata]|eukprot:XP_004355364.1 hypothetical protein DFA_07871 [Cavenderia fasciculata]
MQTNNNNTSLSCLLQSTCILPWTVQSEIIYIICNYRKNQDCKEIRPKDVYHVAGVSRQWRHATKVSLTLNWRINISRQFLHEYRQHYEHPFSLLSSLNHNIEINFGIGSIKDNLEYARINLDWFNNTIINKISNLKIIYTNDMALKWIELIKGCRLPSIDEGGEGGVPSLKTLSIQQYDGTNSLFIFNHLQELDINFRGNSTTKICNILNSCHNLKSLTMGLYVSPKIDTNQVVSSIPRTLTRLSWSGISELEEYTKHAKPLPFHFLPTTIRQLLIWDINQTCTQEYYDFVTTNSVHTVAQCDQSTQECINFLSSSSSPVKHLYLKASGHSCYNTPVSILEKAIVPPSIQVLELQFTYIEQKNGLNTLESIFKYSGPLPNLHTLIFESREMKLPEHLATFIRSSQSLRMIDFGQSFFGTPYHDNFELFLNAMAQGNRIEKVYIRYSPSLKNTIDRAKQHLQTIKNNPLVLIIDTFYLLIINTNNNRMADLSSYNIVENIKNEEIKQKGSSTNKITCRI